MNVPEDLLFTEHHQWIRADGDIGTVGITDHAQKALRDIELVEMPEVARTLSPGEELGSIESSKAVVGLYSPVGGEVLDVNQMLLEDPGLVNREPYEGGWICRIRIGDPAELSQLMTGQQYERFCGKER